METTIPVIEYGPAKPQRRTIDLHITSSCQSRCFHCAIGNYSGSRNNTLNRAYLDAIFKGLDQSNVSTLVISGGEPLMQPDLVDYIVNNVMDAGRSVLALSTNGLADGLSLSVRQAAVKGRMSICVSIDGANQTADSQTRGIGHFNRAVSFVKQLANIGISPTILCCVHKGNRKSAVSLPLIAQKWGALRVSFIYFVPVGYGSVNMDSLGMTEWNEFAEEIRSGYYNSNIGISLELVCVELHTILELTEEERESLCCPAEKGNMLSVGPDGRVFPCILLMRNEYVVGRADEVEINDLFNRAANLVKAQSALLKTSCDRDFNCSKGCLYFAKTFGEGGCDPRCSLRDELVSVCPLLWAKEFQAITPRN